MIDLKIETMNSESGSSRPPIFWNYALDKGKLKHFVSWFLKTYGEKKTLELLEQLKVLGFGYATEAGISLGIEDLKIPPKKYKMLAKAKSFVDQSRFMYKRGDLTDLEKTQSFMQIWNEVNEDLKDEVVAYFQKTNIFNPVYMMAFSGARGNLSQVRQLVGMRGLMSDPQGKIIDFPILSNFREGLTLTEYLISTYGARKGIVDTALRTATAGYLTRRLVDVAQHVVVSKLDCGTQRGIFLFDMKDGAKTIYAFQNRLIGRVLAQDISLPNQKELTTLQKVQGNTNTFTFANSSLIDSANVRTKVALRNMEVDESLAHQIAKVTKRALVRSPLTCEQVKRVCQLCYGWSLSTSRLVSIGEAVGVIAGQSIGEPGTQLTMRTFHTGGVFAGNITEQINAPFDGRIEYSHPMAGSLLRVCLAKNNSVLAFLTKSGGTMLVKPTLPTNQKTTSFDNCKPEATPEQAVEKEKLYKLPGFTLLFARHGEWMPKQSVLAQISGINALSAGASTQGIESQAKATQVTNTTPGTAPDRGQDELNRAAKPRSGQELPDLRAADSKVNIVAGMSKTTDVNRSSSSRDGSGEQNRPLSQKGMQTSEQTVYTSLEGEVYYSQLDLIEEIDPKYGERVSKSENWAKVWVLAAKIFQNPLGYNLSSQTSPSTSIQNTLGPLARNQLSSSKTDPYDRTLGSSKVWTQSLEEAEDYKGKITSNPKNREQSLGIFKVKDFISNQTPVQDIEWFSPFGSMVSLNTNKKTMTTSYPALKALLQSNSQDHIRTTSISESKEGLKTRVCTNLKSRLVLGTNQYKVQGRFLSPMHSKTTEIKLYPTFVSESFKITKAWKASVFLKNAQVHLPILAPGTLKRWLNHAKTHSSNSSFLMSAPLWSEKTGLNKGNVAQPLILSNRMPFILDLKKDSSPSIPSKQIGVLGRLRNRQKSSADYEDIIKTMKKKTMGVNPYDLSVSAENKNQIPPNRLLLQSLRDCLSTNYSSVQKQEGSKTLYLSPVDKKEHLEKVKLARSKKPRKTSDPLFRENPFAKSKREPEDLFMKEGRLSFPVRDPHYMKLGYGGTIQFNLNSAHPIHPKHDVNNLEFPWRSNHIESVQEHRLTSPQCEPARVVRSVEKPNENWKSSSMFMNRTEGFFSYLSLNEGSSNKTQFLNNTNLWQPNSTKGVVWYPSEGEIAESGIYLVEEASFDLVARDPVSVRSEKEGSKIEVPKTKKQRQIWQQKSLNRLNLSQSQICKQNKTGIIQKNFKANKFKGFHQTSGLSLFNAPFVKTLKLNLQSVEHSPWPRTSAWNRSEAAPILSPNTRENRRGTLTKQYVRKFFSELNTKFKNKDIKEVRFETKISELSKTWGKILQNKKSQPIKPDKIEAYIYGASPSLRQIKTMEAIQNVSDLDFRAGSGRTRKNEESHLGSKTRSLKQKKQKAFKEARDKTDDQEGLAQLKILLNQNQKRELAFTEIFYLSQKNYQVPNSIMGSSKHIAIKNLRKAQFFYNQKQGLNFTALNCILTNYQGHKKKFDFGPGSGVLSLNSSHRFSEKAESKRKGVQIRKKKSKTEAPFSKCVLFEPSLRKFIVNHGFGKKKLGRSKNQNAGWNPLTLGNGQGQEFFCLKTGKAYFKIFPFVQIKTDTRLTIEAKTDLNTLDTGKAFFSIDQSKLQHPNNKIKHTHLSPRFLYGKSFGRGLDSAELQAHSSLSKRAHIENGFNDDRKETGKGISSKSIRVHFKPGWIYYTFSQKNTLKKKKKIQELGQPLLDDLHLEYQKVLYEPLRKTQFSFSKETSFVNRLDRFLISRTDLGGTSRFHVLKAGFGRIGQQDSSWTNPNRKSSFPFFPNFETISRLDSGTRGQVGKKGFRIPFAKDQEATIRSGGICYCGSKPRFCPKFPLKMLNNGGNEKTSRAYLIRPFESRRMYGTQEKKTVLYENMRKIENHGLGRSYQLYRNYWNSNFNAQKDERIFLGFCAKLDLELKNIPMFKTSTQSLLTKNKKARKKLNKRKKNKPLSQFVKKESVSTSSNLENKKKRNTLENKKRGKFESRKQRKQIPQINLKNRKEKGYEILKKTSRLFKQEVKYKGRISFVLKGKKHKKLKTYKQSHFALYNSNRGFNLFPYALSYKIEKPEWKGYTCSSVRWTSEPTTLFFRKSTTQTQKLFIQESLNSMLQKTKNKFLSSTFEPLTQEKDHMSTLSENQTSTVSLRNNFRNNKKCLSQKDLQKSRKLAEILKKGHLVKKLNNSFYFYNVPKLEFGVKMHYNLFWNARLQSSKSWKQSLEQSLKVNNLTLQTHPTTPLTKRANQRADQDLDSANLHNGKLLGLSTFGLLKMKKRMVGQGMSTEKWPKWKNFLNLSPTSLCALSPRDHTSTTMKPLGVTRFYSPFEGLVLKDYAAPSSNPNEETTENVKKTFNIHLDEVLLQDRQGQKLILTKEDIFSLNFGSDRKQVDKGQPVSNTLSAHFSQTNSKTAIMPVVASAASGLASKGAGKESSGEVNVNEEKKKEKVVRPELKSKLEKQAVLDQISKLESFQQVLEKHAKFQKLESAYIQKAERESYQILNIHTKYQDKSYKLNQIQFQQAEEPTKFRIGHFSYAGDSLYGPYCLPRAGQIIHLNHSKVTFRKAEYFSLLPRAILHAYNGQTILPNKPVMTLAFESLNSGDIVQGIPKVEQYLEARTTIQGRLFLNSLPVLLYAIYKRYLGRLEMDKAVRQSLLKIQQILVDGVQRVYRSQGVGITDKHLEVIVRQMTSKVKIIYGGQTGFFPGELVDLDLVERVNKSLVVKVVYEPIVLGITRASLEVDSFLSAASFQQTTKVLTRAALENKRDFLKGLKENLLVGNLLPAGTGYVVPSKIF